MSFSIDGVTLTFGFDAAFLAIELADRISPDFDA